MADDTRSHRRPAFWASAVIPVIVSTSIPAAIPAVHAARRYVPCDEQYDGLRWWDDGEDEFAGDADTANGAVCSTATAATATTAGW